jgi:hypothetical protein
MDTLVHGTRPPGNASATRSNRMPDAGRVRHPSRLPLGHFPKPPPLHLPHDGAAIRR